MYIPLVCIRRFYVCPFSTLFLVMCAYHYADLSQWSLTMIFHNDLSQWSLTMISHNDLSQWPLVELKDDQQTFHKQQNGYIKLVFFPLSTRYQVVLSQPTYSFNRYHYYWSKPVHYHYNNKHSMFNFENILIQWPCHE